VLCRCNARSSSSQQSPCRPVISECTDLHRIFRIGTHMTFLRSLKGCCYGNQSLAQISENWHSPPSFCALAFHNGWKDCNVDTHVNTVDNVSTSDKKFDELDSVTLLCRSELTQFAPCARRMKKQYSTC